MPAIIQSAGQLQTIEPAEPWALSSASWGPRSLALYNFQRQSYSQIIRSQPNVRTVIGFIARNIAQLGVGLYERRSDTDRQKITGHPFAEAMRRPNPLDRRLTTYRLMHRTVWDVCAVDCAFWALIPATRGERVAIVPLQAEKMEVKGNLWPTAYEYHGARGSIIFDPTQIVHFQGSHDLDDPLAAVPPIEALRRIIAEDIAAGEYREQFWASGARTSGWIKRPATSPDWSNDARDRFRADWSGLYSGHGPGAGGTPILEDDMEFHQSENADARSAQYVEARKLSRAEAAALWHVDPIWVGIAEAGTAFASVVERHKALYQDTLGPWTVMLEQDLTFQALPAFEPDPEALAREYVKLNIAEKLRGSIDDIAEKLGKAAGRPFLTVNEVRALAERNDIDGGDGLALPLNTTIVGGDTAPPEPGEPEPPPVPALPARRPLSSGRKAVGVTIDQHQAIATAHVEAHRKAVERTFERQHAEVESVRGAADAPTVEDLWDAERWDTELALDLLGLALELASDYGGAVADALGFEDVDPELWLPYLDENTSIAAANINDTTAAALGDALAEDDPGEAIRNLFIGAGVARAAQIAQTRYTTVSGFVGQDTAAQAGRSAKVWNVTSSNSRHPELDGEEAPFGEAFSNGMAWPGDPVGDVNQTAGCTCFLTYA